MTTEKIKDLEDRKKKRPNNSHTKLTKERREPLEPGNKKTRQKPEKKAEHTYLKDIISQEASQDKYIPGKKMISKTTQEGNKK